MNFLAHCALAATSDQLLVGGFLGDFVKGAIPESLPTEIRRGIRLHRRLDAFSNTEPLIQVSVSRLPKHLRRFAPPFVDLLADHLLARDFERHHGEPLTTFSRRSYGLLDDHRAWLPASAARFLDFMRDADLFDRYREFDSVGIAFNRLMARLDRVDVVAPMVARAQAQLADLQRDFELYYPSLRDHAAAWLNAERQSC